LNAKPTKVERLFPHGIGKTAGKSSDFPHTQVRVYIRSQGAQRYWRCFVWRLGEIKSMINHIRKTAHLSPKRTPTACCTVPMATIHAGQASRRDEPAAEKSEIDYKSDHVENYFESKVDHACIGSRSIETKMNAEASNEFPFEFIRS
jgi:hypothetical protein